MVNRLAGMDALNEDVEWRPRFVALPYIWKAGAPLHEVVDAVAAQQQAFAYISSEQNGLGAMPTAELKRKLRGGGTWNPVFTTNATKTAMFGAVLALLEREQLFLPQDPTLLRQLAGLRFEQGERGFTRIENDAALSQHDDVADGLGLSMMPHRPRGGGVACRLMSLASPQAPLPDAELGGYEGRDVLETASGLRVHRRPPLQSVKGDAVSFPTGHIPQLEPATVGPFRIERNVTYE